jgi:hypothetical protein
LRIKEFFGTGLQITNTLTLDEEEPIRYPDDKEGKRIGCFVKYSWFRFFLQNDIAFEIFHV